MGSGQQRQLRGGYGVNYKTGKQWLAESGFGWAGARGEGHLRENGLWHNGYPQRCCIYDDFCGKDESVDAETTTEKNREHLK